MRYLPDIALPSTMGGEVNLSRLPGRTMVFCYPYTGRPGIPDPPDWDNIPGAHGSTPQATGYAALYDQFQDVGIEVFGLSLQDTGWQKEFAQRANLPFALLSDRNAAFSQAMKLETFRAGQIDFLRRITLVVRNGSLENTNPDIAAPEQDAANTLKLLHY